MAEWNEALSWHFACPSQSHVRVQTTYIHTCVACILDAKNAKVKMMRSPTGVPVVAPMPGTRSAYIPQAAVSNFQNAAYILDLPPFSPRP